MGSSGDDSAAMKRQALVEALDKVAHGDRSALQKVYKSTSAKLFGICLRISKDREIAEDILQEVYIKVWRRSGRYDPSKASPVTWLATIARNSAIDAIRRRKPVQRESEDVLIDVPDESPLADAKVEARERSEKIEECLDELDEKHRECVVEAFYEGYTYSQLAEVKKVPLGTMKSWIRRSLARLKECLGG